MKRMISVSSASFLIGRGEPVLRKALRERKFTKAYLLGFGEKTSVRLLDVDEIREIWHRSVTMGYEDRLRELESRSYIITTPDGEELQVLGGTVWEHSPEAEQKRKDRFLEESN